MKPTLVLFSIALGFFLFACSSTEMVENWKNPDIVIFDAQKVLIVGLTHNEEARTKFETQLQQQFAKRNVEAYRSIDIFDIDFTDIRRTEKELDSFEESLLEKDFDAILFTKVIGSDSHESFVRSIYNLSNPREGFREDYLRNQDLYNYEGDYYQSFPVYHAETSLYCICSGKERSLIWRGSIDIVDPRNLEKTIDDYVELLVMAMEEQDLIFRKDG